MSTPSGRPDSAPAPTSQRGAAAASTPRSGGRAGFIALAVLVSFVALWLAVQGRQALRPADRAVGLTDDTSLPGFRANAWQLPDEPLLGLVEIPAGSFLMGSDPAVDRQAYENERWSEALRQGTVELPAYYIGRFEVTVAQYRAFVLDTGRAALPEALAAPPDHPITQVTWADALAYCRWLQQRLLDSDQTPAQLREKLQAEWQLTLPTEAQWEKAARGAAGAIYPWGNQLEEGRANVGTGATRPVGSVPCPECQYGLSDMSGNVWELTRSPYQPYPFTDADDRDTLGADALWVMRGGSFADGPANVRTAVRGGVDPGVRNGTIGFRLALVPPGQ